MVGYIIGSVLLGATIGFCISYIAVKGFKL